MPDNQPEPEIIVLEPNFGQPLSISPLVNTGPMLEDAWVDIVVRLVDKKDCNAESRPILSTEASFRRCLQFLKHPSYSQRICVKLLANASWLLSYLALNGSAQPVSVSWSCSLNRSIFNNYLPANLADEIDSIGLHYVCVESFSVVTEDGRPYDVRKLHRMAALHKLSFRA